MNKETAQNMTKSATNSADGVLSNLKDNAIQFLEDRKENFTDASEYTNKGVQKARSVVKNNPFSAVAGAFAAGALITLLLKRK